MCFSYSPGCRRLLVSLGQEVSHDDSRYDGSESKPRHALIRGHGSREKPGGRGRLFRCGRSRHEQRNHLWRRVYGESSPRDGKRVFVDRVWPHDTRKEDPHLDEWLRDIASSTELRRWYGHDPGRFAEFRRCYLAEVRDAPSPPPGPSSAVTPT
jgi:hypothetical protein